MGPLSGLKVIELQGIGPGPYCGMMLADMGAEVTRIDRAANVGRGGGRGDLLARGRKSIAIDLKNPQGIETALRLIDGADVLIEGFRPGVMERLGLGPDTCLERNPGLVYGRMTGWGQTGSLSQAAGHDINYISLTGALHAIGEEGGKPVPPLNLIGDFGGGGMLLAFGVLAGLYERNISGKGQVVDAAMTDGSALLMNAVFGMMNSGQWKKERGTNMLDSGTHFYNTYQTSDGKYISVGSLEPQFYEILLEKSGLGARQIPAQQSREDWPNMKEQLAEIFMTKTRDEWDEIMLGTDICYAPILSFAEAQKHQHNVDRQTFVEVEGVPQAAPAPRFDRTVPEVPGAASRPGEQTDEVLLAAGLEKKEIDDLRASGAVA
jgi:alpha-methylacyl-CoA racemase|tara:strand:- start:1220 stop:2353 length:1134 start_codon:yes stop_codon:yes gene_type:complete